VTAITVIATITLILAALPGDPVPRRARVLRNATFVVLIGCAVVIALGRSYVQNYAGRNERKVIAEIALRQGIEGDSHLKAATPSRRQFERVLPVLRAARHAPFHWRSRCEALLGQSVPAAAAADPATGRLETVSTYEMAEHSERALALSGFAARDGTPAECIVIVDGSGTAIGAGASVSERPDLEQSEGHSLGRVGWRAVAAPPPSATVCALALFPGEAKPIPLAACKPVAADARR
jgi:hypothetical protein